MQLDPLDATQGVLEFPMAQEQKSTCTPVVEALKRLLLAFERRIPWRLVQESWRDLRPAWVDETAKAEFISDLFESYRLFLLNFDPQSIPTQWNEDPLKSQIERRFQSASARDFVYLIFQFAKMVEETQESAILLKDLFTECLSVLRVHVLSGADLDVLFPDKSSQDPLTVIRRALLRLEVGINWSGVFPTFRNARDDWTALVNGATQVSQCVEAWRQFESFCNWENLGKSFLPLQEAWRKNLAACDSFAALAKIMLEMESHCVEERLSGVYRTEDRQKWRVSVESVAKGYQVPSLQSLVCQMIVLHSIPRESVDLPQDLLESIEDAELVYSLILAGASTTTQYANQTPAALGPYFVGLQPFYTGH